MLLEGKLSGEKELELQRHIEACGPCQQKLEQLEAEDTSANVLASHLRDPRTPVDTALETVMHEMRGNGVESGFGQDR